MTNTDSTDMKIQMTIETTKAYDNFKLAERPWLPEVRSGDSLKPLIADITANGLQEPIIADHEGTIFIGRSRFMACKEAQKEIRVHRISTEAAEQMSKSRRNQRELTVLDRVRLVGHVRSEIQKQELTGKLRENLSKALRETWGWLRGNSEGQVMKYLQILDHLEKSEDKSKDEEMLRHAAHLNEATRKLFRVKSPEAKASTGNEAVAAQNTGTEPVVPAAVNPAPSLPLLKSRLESALKKLGDEPANLTKAKLVKFVEKVRSLVDPKPKPIPPPKEAPEAAA